MIRITSARANGVSLEFDEGGRPLALSAGPRRWELAADGLTFGLGGEAARLAGVCPGEGRLEAVLRNAQGEARLSVASGESVRIEIVPAPGAGRLKRSFSLLLPADAECHLPAALNTGWMFAADMPVGEHVEFRQPYQFALVVFREGVLSWRTASLGQVPAGEPLPAGGRYAAPVVAVDRVEQGLRLTFRWDYDSPLHLQWFPSLEAATADYARWLEGTFQIAPRGQAPHRPDWLWNTRLAFTVDMWRPHGEIAHNYQHVIGLMKDLQAAGAPPDTLLYLTGWNWRYDGHYPEYRPHPVLGGKARFQEMVETAHRTGCRLMLHLCGPGYDPYLPGFQRWKQAAHSSTERKRIPRVWEPQDKENILTWLGGLITPLDFDTGRQRLTHAWDGDERSITFAAPPMPVRTEAYLTLGGVRAGVRVTINGRTQESYDEHLARPDGYSFPFPFYFQPGNNEVHVQSLAGEVDDWSSLWFHVHDAMTMKDVWTYPIAAMDINDPGWQSWLVNELVELAQSTQVDALHLDTHHVGVDLWDWRPALAAIRAQVPGLVFGSEVQDEQGLQNFAITQSSSLWPYVTRKFGFDPQAGGRLAWQHRSPVSRQVSHRYLRIYPHLIDAAGFVPTGTVVDHEPPSLATGAVKRGKEELLAHADEVGVIPTLRVNYRDYGLDPAARAFVAARGAGS